MKRKRLIWLLFPSLWGITIIALVAVTIYISQTFEKFYLDQVVADLKSEATMVSNRLAAEKQDSVYFVESDFCHNLFNNVPKRLTIIDSSGNVLCDSEEDAAAMENHSSRPEFASALEGETGLSIRYSQTLEADLIYVAIPHYYENKIIGAVRTSVSIASIHEALVEIYWKVSLGGLAVTLLIILASLYTSSRLTGPLKRMVQVAELYADGELDHRMPDHESHEIGILADSMNQMAIDLNDRINAVIRQRNEQQAMLLSMVEGVLAIDMDERVININKAAEKMLGVSIELAQGRYIYEVVRNTQIQQFVKRVLTEMKAVETEIVLSRRRDIYIQAHGAVLKGADGKQIGAVIVLNNITKLRELENIRRDFVANVSHELKTPITSIKGFVETLQDGAINNPEDAQRFLAIIVKQAGRLNSIVEDLLSLSRIEEKEEKAGIKFRVQKLRPVLKACIQTCEPNSRTNEISIELNCDENLQANINEDLFHQAVVNLLNNAIKYSPKGDTVTVRAYIENDSVKISVSDNGIGIPKEHQARIFERFYRVDKERSRQLGGTGLGLAIVKHIILAHKGQVTVDSDTGKGSVFTLILPMSKPAV